MKPIINLLTLQRETATRSSILLCQSASNGSTKLFHTTPSVRSEASGEEENNEGGEIEDNPFIMPEIDPQTSIRYMKSRSYEITYAGVPVWKPYRRNHKGSIAPKKTRKSCIRAGVLATGNPCPICRDKYLVVHETNVELLKQFISEYSGELLSYEQTGVCQKEHKKLMIAIEKARDIGLIDKQVPFRKYNYADYYPSLKEKAV